MDRCLAKQAHRAHVQEARAERKEARLHAQATRAALHGNIGKAVAKEMRASKQASVADHARARELAATNAMVTHHCNHGNMCRCCHPGNIPHGPPVGRVTVYQPPPPPGVTTVVQATYTGPPPVYTQQYPPYPAYPTGVAPPPGPRW